MSGIRFQHVAIPGYRGPMRVVVELVPEETPGVERAYLLRAPGRGQAHLALGILRAGAAEVVHYPYYSHWVRPFLLRLIRLERRCRETVPGAGAAGSREEETS